MRWVLFFAVIVFIAMAVASGEDKQVRIPTDFYCLVDLSLSVAPDEFDSLLRVLDQLAFEAAKVGDHICIIGFCLLPRLYMNETIRKENWTNGYQSIVRPRLVDDRKGKGKIPPADMKRTIMQGAFDHMITTCYVRRLQDNTQNPKKVLLVLTDGITDAQFPILDTLMIGYAEQNLPSERDWRVFFVGVDTIPKSTKDNFFCYHNAKELTFSTIRDKMAFFQPPVDTSVVQRFWYAVSDVYDSPYGKLIMLISAIMGAIALFLVHLVIPIRKAVGKVQGPPAAPAIKPPMTPTTQRPSAGRSAVLTSPSWTLTAEAVYWNDDEVTSPEAGVSPPKPYRLLRDVSIRLQVHNAGAKKSDFSFVITPILWDVQHEKIRINGRQFSLSNGNWLCQFSLCSFVSEKHRSKYRDQADVYIKEARGEDEKVLAEQRKSWETSKLARKTDNPTDDNITLLEEYPVDLFAYCGKPVAFLVICLTGDSQQLADQSLKALVDWHKLVLRPSNGNGQRDIPVWRSELPGTYDDVLKLEVS